MTLKDWMKIRRWKSVEVAGKLGVSLSFVSLLASGRRMPGPEPELMARIGRMTGHTVTLQDFAQNYHREEGKKAVTPQVVHSPR
jgi:transcriptional regulator with XRE-family HTH domain